MDLNIDNYNYNEILQIYKLANDFDETNIHKMEKTLDLVKEQLTHEYYNFYLKAYKIILFIYSLFDNNIISENDRKKIELYTNKIKRIHTYEHFEVDDIYNVLKISRHQIGDKFAYSHKTNADYDKINLSYDQIYVPTLQKQMVTNVVESTNNNNVAPGQLNSIKRVTQFLNLNLNTCFRSNYYNSNPCNFQYIIPAEIKNVVSLRLASIEIPNSWYLFSSKKENNFFQIEINNNGIKTVYDIVVPDGNYDISTLVDYLNNNYFYNSGTTNDLQYIEYLIDPYSSKSRFQLTGLYPSNFSFTLIFIKDNPSQNLNVTNTFGWIIGFRLTTYKSINVFVISEGIFDAGGDRYIYVSIDDYQYNTNTLNIVCFDNSIMEEHIIAKIPMVNGKLSLIIDDNSSPLTKTRKYNGPVNIRNLFIKILDQYGEIIDLNNMDYSLTLELEILYEGFNFRDINS
jgi:hypothetical protein